ncbi:MAG: ATP-binding protein [Nitrospirota bacterium]
MNTFFKGKVTKRDIRILAGVFGPILALFIVLITFQYSIYSANKKRVEEHFNREQGLVTDLAAERLQAYLHGIVWNIGELGFDVSGTSDRARQSELMNRVYDTLGGSVDGIALYDRDGNRTNSVSGRGKTSLPASSRFEDFFAVAKQTAVPFISPLTKIQDGEEAVYISYPLRDSSSGDFGGVVAAEIHRPSFSRVRALFDDIGGGKTRFIYFDQLGQKVCTDASCLPGQGKVELPSEGAKVQIISLKGTDTGRAKRVRLLYRPMQVEGYRWYFATEMPLEAMDGMLHGDLAMLNILVGFLLLTLAGGGLYFSRIYKAKDMAENEARLQAMLVSKGIDLEYEKDKLLTVLNSIPDGIIILDREGSVAETNARAKEIAGGRSGNELRDIFFAAGEDGEAVFDGKSYKVVSMPVSGAGTGGVGEIRILRDITMEKALEQKKKDLVSMITHDIKSPLTVIIGISQWLSEKKAQAAGLEQEIGEGLEAIYRAANRVLNLMDNFIFLSSVEGMRKLRKKPVNLNNFLTKALLEFYLEAKQKKIKLDFNIPEGTMIVPMDETQMMRAFSNIISNALKYTDEGGEVRVSAKNFRDYIAIMVSDTGHGISKNDMPYIFEQYFRAKSARKVPKGSGLGLSIVKAVVESHGGTVDVESEESKGSVFTLRLPLHNHSKSI